MTENSFKLRNRIHELYPGARQVHEIAPIGSPNKARTASLSFRFRHLTQSSAYLTILYLDWATGASSASMPLG